MQPDNEIDETPRTPKRIRPSTGRGVTLKPLSERNDQFRIRNGEIMLWVIQFLEERKRFPQYEEAAQHFNLSRRWISEHFKYIESYTTYSEQLKQLTPMVLQSFGQRVIKSGRAADVIAWMKLVEGWIDPNVIAAAAIPPAPTDATPIGELTAVDDELRDLETEFWLTLRRRAQESAGSDAVPGEGPLPADGTPYPPEPHGEGSDRGET